MSARRVMCLERAWKLYASHPHTALCVSSLWLLLNCELYNKCNQEYGTFLSSVRHSSKLLSQREIMSSRESVLVGDTICSWHLNWGKSWGTQPLHLWSLPRLQVVGVRIELNCSIPRWWWRIGFWKNVTVKSFLLRKSNS